MSAEAPGRPDPPSAGTPTGPGARRTVVKVCGLTRREDASWAAECGADWLGFIVHGESPRAIAPERAAEIVDRVRAAVPVAVMVGVIAAEALDLARRAHAKRVQLHGVSPRDWPDDFPLPCAFVVGMTNDGALVGEEPAARYLMMLDGVVSGRTGGTGTSWPLAAARPIVARRDVMLAGGLHGDNVEEAVRVLAPFGVDASSGLESSPGLKDPERVRRFVEAVRRCEASPERTR
jgi:phosphoribosylanthranilate isomerase